MSTITANRLTSPEAVSPTGIVHGAASPLTEIVRTCDRIARSDASVLLTGETGTGKEVFARAIHDRSTRAGGPLVAVNCGAIPEALLESELFGHVRGAFTGASGARRGRVAMAAGGTLFLDEVGELPLSLQVKLLRVLQERSYEPVGSSESLTADFRLVAATNRDLAEEVAAGRFRRDLYYRLCVCPIEIPALRNRNGDVLHLFRHFWTRRGEVRPIDAAVLEAFQRYDWPGNVRELENLVERLSVCAEGAIVGVADLPAALRRLAEDAPVTPQAPPPSLALVPGPAATPVPGALPVVAVAGTGEDESAAVRALLAQDEPPVDPRLSAGRPVDLPGILRRLEDAYITTALSYTGGNKKAAADLLGLQRTTLVEKLRRRSKEPVAAE